MIKVEGFCGVENQLDVVIKDNDLMILHNSWALPKTELYEQLHGKKTTGRIKKIKN